MKFHLLPFLLLASCTSVSKDLYGTPAPGTPATLTFENAPMGEGLKFGWTKRSSFIGPKVDGKYVGGRIGIQYTIKLYPGEHHVRSGLTIVQGTDALEQGLDMKFKAAPGRAYVLRATSEKRKGHHVVRLFDGEKEVQSTTVPYDSYQRIAPVFVPVLPAQ